MASIVSVFSNGYVYPREESNGFGSISSSGLGAWTNRSGVTRVFFYPQRSGKIEVAISAKSSGNDTLRLSLNGSTSDSHDVKVPNSSSFARLNVGAYNIPKAGYHYLEISAVTKNSTYLPDVEALVISGEAAEGLKFNKSNHRGAPSTHLFYHSNHGITKFYSEVYVQQGDDPVAAFYMVNGFDGGYFGIQVNSSTERRVLFSIWSNYDTQDPQQIPSEYKVKLVKKGANVINEEFGNEGAGAHSYLKYMWKTNTIYKLLVKAEASGNDNTVYTGYFHKPESGWELIAQYNKPKTNGKLLGGPYAFVENFGSNGNDYFKAQYENQWAYISGEWVELTKATFGTTASESDHQRYDYGAGAQGSKMYMYSGGFKATNNVSAGAVIERTATGNPPQGLPA